MNDEAHTALRHGAPGLRIAAPGGPADLSGCGAAGGNPQIEPREQSANITSCPGPADQSDSAGLDAQMLAGPARTWIEVAEKCRFLLHRYGESEASEDLRTRKLIARALGDIARLKKREDAKHDA